MLLLLLLVSDWLPELSGMSADLSTLLPEK